MRVANTLDSIEGLLRGSNNERGSGVNRPSSSDMQKAAHDLSDAAQKQHDAAEMQIEAAEGLSESSGADPGGERTLSVTEGIKNIMESWGIPEFFNKFLRSVDRMSEYMNTGIQQLGTDRAGSQQFRSDVSTRVSELNDVTNSRFNAVESVGTMLSIANRTSIKNQGTLIKLTKPILLAQETMNANIEGIAEIGNRLVLKNNISEAQLTGMLDHLRSTTANRNASEEEIVELWTRMETSIYNAAQLTHDTEESRQNYIENIHKSLTELSTWMQENLVDMDPYEQMVNRLLTGTVSTEDLRFYAQAGLDVNELYRMVTSGDEGMIDAVTMMAQGVADSYNANMKAGPFGGYNVSRIANLEGFSLDQYDDWAGMTGKEVGESIKEAMSAEKGSTMEGAAADMYTSATERVENAFSEAAAGTASFQEATGIGIREIVSIISSIQGTVETISVMSGVNAGSGILGMFKGGGGGGAGGLLGGIKGFGTKALGAMKGIGSGIASGFKGLGSMFASGIGKIGTFFGGASGMAASGGVGLLGVLGPMAGIAAGAVAAIVAIQKAMEDWKKAWERGDKARTTSMNQLLDKMEDPTFSKEDYIGQMMYKDEEGKWTSKSLYNDWDSLGVEERNKYGSEENYINTLRSTVANSMEDYINNRDWWDIWDNLATAEVTEQIDKLMRMTIEDQTIGDLFAMYSTKMIAEDDEESRTKLAADLVDNGRDSEYYRMYYDAAGNPLPDDSRMLHNFKEDKDYHATTYGLATGTPYIPYDGFQATLHEGEAVIPKKYNIFNPFDSLQETMRKLNNNTSTPTSGVTLDSELLSELREIKEFLKWNSEDQKATERINSTKDRLSMKSSTGLKTLFSY